MHFFEQFVGLVAMTLVRVELGKVNHGAHGAPLAVYLTLFLDSCFVEFFRLSIPTLISIDTGQRRSEGEPRTMVRTPSGTRQGIAIEPSSVFVSALVTIDLGQVRGKPAEASILTSFTTSDFQLLEECLFCFLVHSHTGKQATEGIERNFVIREVLSLHNLGLFP